jgi:hypothetical protein
LADDFTYLKVICWGWFYLSGCDTARVVHKPRLLSDNGGSSNLFTARPIIPRHQTLKNRTLLETTTCPPISKLTSLASSSIIIIGAIRRA